MKNVYETPSFEILVLDTEDVLAISVVTDEKGELTEISWDSLA